jgi:DNA-binding beta-propeller fold protein YncE
VVATVPVGIRPFAVAVTPDGKHAYVTNADSTNVSVIDTAATP